VAEGIVLLSGGVDSAVCMYVAVKELRPENVTALFFNWGQRSAREELRAARALCEAAGVSRFIVSGIMFPYGGILTEESAHLPLDRTESEIEEAGIAPTFFPGRNLVFLAFAFGLAGASGASNVYFGPSALDDAGYPDCRAGFIRSAQAAGRLALDSPEITIVTPLLEMTKAQVVSMGQSLGVPWDLTFSCYAPAEGAPCGRCDSCVTRQAAFESAGIDYTDSGQ
jgi:7-cyano-7-deazaguanine synthase